MTTLCSEVATHTVLGEPLGSAETQHLAGCPACTRLVRLPGLLGAPRPIEPPPGFAARTAQGVHLRRRARRRRRIGVAAAAGVVILASALIMLMPRLGSPRATADRPPIPPAPIVRAVAMAPTPDPDGDAKLLAELAALPEVDRALEDGADWQRIQQPLSPLLPLTQEDSP